ncbi:MAG TPA: DUF2267 domain-containing protein [Candidatus Binatia bacterium]|jgi:uncharacterized protein (DUF2267 family)
MNATVEEIFGKTLAKTHVWLTELMAELDWQDEHKAYLALRAVLHTLRDRLTVEEAADLAAQLPMLVRGFYFEGWNPRGKPVKERHQEGFLFHVQTYFKFDDRVDPEAVVRSVFKLLRRHISRGEVDDIKHILPGELRELWA